MSEFNIAQWSDFVRGVTESEMTAQMREHLDAEPESARRTVEALRRVATVGRSDSDSPVPSGAVRIAKATFGTPRADAGREVRRLPCWIAFDSLLEPAAAGTRGAQESHRELTFEAQGYSVDVRLEQEPSLGGSSFSGTPPSMVVVGQLLRQGEDSSRPVPRAPVFMFSGERLIGKAVTGRHGEFQVEGSSQGPPQEWADKEPGKSLSILAGEDYLEMPLADPDPAAESEEDPP